MTNHDPVNPPHYKNHPSGVECIAITEHLGFCDGNAVKYIWRAPAKPLPQRLVDLRKARWYIDREIARLEKTAPAEKTPVDLSALEENLRALPPEPRPPNPHVAARQEMLRNLALWTKEETIERERSLESARFAALHKLAEKERLEETRREEARFEPLVFTKSP